MTGDSTTAIGGGGASIRTSGGGVIGGGGTLGMSLGGGGGCSRRRRLFLDVERLEILGRLLDHIVGEAGNDRIAERELQNDDHDDRYGPVAADLFL